MAARGAEENIVISSFEMAEKEQKKYQKSAATALNSGELRAKKMQDYKSVHSLYDPDKGTSWGLCEMILMFFAWFLMIIPIFWFFMIKTVRDYERALIFRLGKIKGGAEGPGVFLVNPLMDKIFIVDLRIETYNLPPQGLFCLFVECILAHIQCIHNKIYI